MPSLDKELAQRKYWRMAAGGDAERAAGVGANQLGANRACLKGGQKALRL